MLLVCVVSLFSCSAADFLCDSREVTQPLWAFASNKTVQKARSSFLDRTPLFLLWVGRAVVPVSIRGKGIELLRGESPVTDEPKCHAQIWVRCLLSELELERSSS